MPKLISLPVALTIRPAAATPTGFANGSDKGNYDTLTDTWTPGRLNGLVNAVSWATVPTGRWVQVAGTRLDGLTSAVAAANLGWTTGNMGWDGAMNAWNGFAIDTGGSRVWLVAAGGHGDGANNGIYRFDAFGMSWAVEKMPSNRTLWSASYVNHTSPNGGTYTVCAESQDAKNAEVAAGTWARMGHWAYDEIFWDNSQASSPGSPTARHTYSSVVYSQARNELVMMDRRLWRYSIADGRWFHKEEFPQPVDGSEIYTVYDEKTDELLFGGAGDGVYRSLTYRMADAQWGGAWSPWALYSGCDTRHDRKVTFFKQPVGGVGPFGKYWVYDLDSRSLETAGDVQFAGSLTQADFPNQYYYDNGYGMTFVPGLNRYWIVGRMGNGMMGWVQLDPTTSPWTLSRLTFANAAPPANTLPCRKLVLLPGLNAVLFFSYADQPGYLYKL